VAKLLVNSEKSWCYKLSNIGYYTEAQYETMILDHARAIFPDFITIRFKRIIEDDTGKKKKPDLVLIRNDYKAWWIVEVETSQDNTNLVKDQVSVFLNGDYSDYDGLAKYISKQIQKEHNLKRIPRKRIQSLIKHSVPSVLVVVDGDRKDWEDEFNNMGVVVCVFEIYKNNRSQYSYRLFGNYPYVVKQQSPCRFDSRIPRVLEVTEGSIFAGKNGRIEISYGGDITRWEIIKRENDKAYINYVDTHFSLAHLNTFVLKKSRKNRYFLERS